jgi:hypothetical protein
MKPSQNLRRFFYCIICLEDEYLVYLNTDNQTYEY